MSINKNLIYVVLISFAIFSCKDQEESASLPPAKSEANFTYTVDQDNPNMLTFTGAPSSKTWYTHWNFGDNTSAEGLEVKKTFYVKGNYDVTFKVFTNGGSTESTQTVTIENDLTGSNLVSNGTLDDDSDWSLLTIANGVDITFENGKVTWTGGGWGQSGIYQLINVEANKTYQIQMDVAGSGMSDCWFEVYVGSVTPTDGVDYTDGGIRLGLNTWDGCGSEPFDGPLTSLSCSVGGGDGTFRYDEDQSLYLVIRSGGANLGTTGVSVDNITIRTL